MPVAEHDALAVTTVNLKIVNGAPVRVTVNHAAYVMLDEVPTYGRGVDIHDLGLTRTGVATASNPRGTGQQTPPPDRPGKHAALPLRRSRAGAKALVGYIVGAQHIAVEQGNGLIMAGNETRFLDPDHASLAAVVVTEQKIAVAADKPDLRAAFGQSLQHARHLAAEAAGRVVSDPDLEQVAEYP